MVRTHRNNYTHLKKFEKGISKFIKKDNALGYRVAGMRGEIEYWPSGLYDTDRDNAPEKKQYHVPEAFYDRGIKSEMFARYMTFTSWSYRKDGKNWVRDTEEPAPQLVIENELPNWQTPVIPSTGTVNQEDLLAMASSSTPEGKLMLENKAKRPIIHQILTRHNYETIEDFGNRVEKFRLRMYGSIQEKARLSMLP